MNPVASPRQTPCNAAPVSPQTIHAVPADRLQPGVSVLGWPVWLRLLAVLPVVVLLWLAVAWAQLDAAPW